MIISTYDRKIFNLDLTHKELLNFISIFSYINYCIINGYEDQIDNDDIRMLSILEEYSYLLRD